MVSAAIGARVKSVKVGSTLSEGSLRIVPLLGVSAAEPVYRLLGDDTAREVAIEELGQATVPTVKVRNRLRERLLLVDSQTLIGLKQNRTLNMDVLVPAEAEVDVPVSCVEQGRWSARSAPVGHGPLSPRLVRSRKMVSVTSSLRQRAATASDQGEVWNTVACYVEAAGARSVTSAVHDAYAARDEDLRAARDRLRLPAGTVGVAVFHGDRLAGIDLFDKAATLEAIWQRLLDSYTLDWLIHRPEYPATAPTDLGPAVAQALAAASNARWRAFESPGEGRSLRMSGRRLVGSALVHGDRSVVHLQLFPREPGRRPRAAAPTVMTRPAPTRRPAAPPPRAVEGAPAGRCPACGFLLGFVQTGAGTYCNHCGLDERSAP